MLEDESGRLRLIGAALTSELLVTGCIIAVMGTENANGDFEVIDIRLPEMARQPQRWERGGGGIVTSSTMAGKEEPQKKKENGGGKVAIVSGLGITGDEGANVTIDLLMEYLMGEAAHPEEARQITRLIIAGNSLSESAPLPTREDLLSTNNKKTSKKYGYDSSAYNPAPTVHLDSFLAQLLPTIPITLIPGASDPANVSIPQQPIHTAMFPHSRAYTSIPPSTSTSSESQSQKEPGWFDPVTNPFEGDLQGWRILGTGGQPIDDIFKYVEEEEHEDTRLEIMHQMLRWRCSAPTAPDTLCMLLLCCYVIITSPSPPVPLVSNPFRTDTILIFRERGKIIFNRVLSIPIRRTIRHQRNPSSFLRR